MVSLLPGNGIGYAKVREIWCQRFNFELDKGDLYSYFSGPKQVSNPSITSSKPDHLSFVLLAYIYFI